MNIISSCYTILLILISKAIHGLEQESIIERCKGSDADFVWNVTEEENKISQLEWYFNNTNICNFSPEDAFTVNTPYEGRIERIGKAQLRLKNVSLEDEGIYVLFPVLKFSTIENRKKIVLHVLEPPADSCKNELPQDIKCKLPTSYCGRPRVSCVWKINQTGEVLGEGDFVLKSTFKNDEVLFCLKGKALQCVDNRAQFCKQVKIPQPDDQRPSDDGKTQHTDSTTATVSWRKDHEDIDKTLAEILNMRFYFTVLVVLVGLTMMITVIGTGVIIYCINRRKKRYGVHNGECTERTPMDQHMNDSKNEIRFQKSDYSTICSMPCWKNRLSLSYSLKKM